MKQIVYKFLDEYVGTGIYLTHNEDRSFYNIFSNNKTRIITFRVADNWEHIKLFRSESLCKTLSSFFCISEDEAAMWTSVTAHCRRRAVQPGRLPRLAR